MAKCHLSWLWHSLGTGSKYFNSYFMWTTSHFPAAMRSLNPSTRVKAIEIANLMVERGHLDKQRVIAVSVDEARRWARCARVETDPLANQQWPFAQ